MDFDSEELSEFPEVYRRVTVERDLEPAAVLIDGVIAPLGNIKYEQLCEEFVKMGAQLMLKAS